MQIALHAGAHFTEQERLVTSILRNTESLQSRGVHIPLPDSYRALLRGVLNAMSKAPAAPNARSLLLSKLTDGAEPKRIVFSDANFFRTAGTAIQKGTLYPAAAERIRSISNIFSCDDIEVFVGMRNPASLVPLLHDCAHKPEDANFWANRSARHIRWQDVLRSILIAVPQAKITVWCYEDLPFIWSQVIRAILDLEPDAKVAGAFDLLRTLVAREGMEHLRSVLKEYPDLSDDQKTELISSSLSRFAIESEMETEVEMAGWSQDLVDELTELYDEDVANVSNMLGVRFLAP